MRAIRPLDRPIITPDLHPSIGRNIHGPSAIRVPDWIAHRLGGYYLYFADHKGRAVWSDKLSMKPGACPNRGCASGCGTQVNRARRGPACGDRLLEPAERAQTLDAGICW